MGLEECEVLELLGAEGGQGRTEVLRSLIADGLRWRMTRNEPPVHRYFVETLKDEAMVHAYLDFIDAVRDRAGQGAGRGDARSRLADLAGEPVGRGDPGTQCGGSHRSDAGDDRGRVRGGSGRQGGGGALAAAESKATVGTAVTYVGTQATIAAGETAFE